MATNSARQEARNQKAHERSSRRRTQEKPSLSSIDEKSQGQKPNQAIQEKARSENHEVQGGQVQHPER